MAWIFSKLENQTSENTILHLKSIFSRYGILDKYIINNGSQFSKLSDNFQGIMFTLTLVLTYRKQEKQLLLKCSDPYKAILANRSTIIDMLRMSPPPLFLVDASKLT